MQPGVTLSVDVPEPPVMVAGLKLADAPAGCPLTLKLTALLKPLLGVTAAV